MFAYIKLIRPQQWGKNLLVFVGVFFAHKWLMDSYLSNAILMFFAFCATASSIYIFNDFCDIEQDRLHSVKKNRPLASGQVQVLPALIFAAVLLIIGLGLAILTSINNNLWAFIFLLTYVVLNVLYSKILKHITIIDVLVLSASYLLRILSGTDGIGIPTSSWLLLCAFVVTMLMGFGKRLAEKHSQSYVSQRQVVIKYDQTFLLLAITISSSVFLVFYGLYSLDAASIATHGRKLILTYPWVILGVFRYLQLIIQKNYFLEDPSTLIIRDRLLMFIVIGWLITFILVSNYAKL